MDLILGRITPRSYCYKATQQFRETFSLADAGGGDHPRAGRTKPPSHPLRGAEGTWVGGDGWSCSGPSISQGRDAARSPVPAMCVSHASPEDKGCAEWEGGPAGGFAGSTASVVCAKAVGRRINFLRVAHRHPPPRCHLFPNCSAHAPAAEAVAS